ncbi:APC family permease [Couchioplanes caeruleus]|uniref:Porin n=2 Tax=Couchioplanes caeruleus TaxID=56438 RepID=A0A1K0H152_9ACTN|nr:APC family permease [Couchioplanes caeruleus]OJF15427.1 porin [Couchioplanes caeruleus subsp. caeruleus]ROP33437.1 amino acid/polyamine/organocation transporter (APC superfamily) [Couchioplanes caeruleus]
MAAHILNAPPGIEQFGYKQELSRSLRFRDLVIYGLIFMVVIAPFGIFGGVFQASGGMVALAYLIGMVAMMFTASSYAVMVQAYPTAGSTYTYAGRAIAPSVGFLTGWTILLDYVLIPALLGLIAAGSMASVVPAVPVWGWIVVFVAVNTGLNLLGIKVTKQAMRVFLIGELAVLAIYLVVGIAALAAGAGRGFSWVPFFNANTFSLSVAAGAVSVAALSYLGFDAISMLAEETRGGGEQVGRAMYAVLGLTGLLFIAQTFVAALLVDDPGRLIAEGDAAGTAFYDTARIAGGPWVATLTAVATALAWGIANNMVAQLATSRLLYAMGRDRQLPGELARVTRSRSVPANAVLLTAVISLVVGLYMASRADGIRLLVSLVNFGAMASFTVLHIAVIWRWLTNGRDGSSMRNLVVPLVGAAILLMVIVHANIAAQQVGIAWIVAGLLVLLVLHLTGRRPRLSGLDDTSAAHVPAWAGRHV